VRVQRSARLTMTVADPIGASKDPVAAFADGRRVVARIRRGLVTFTLIARVGRAADWAVEAVGSLRR
jgi:hypothetical protein